MKTYLALATICILLSSCNRASDVEIPIFPPGVPGFQPSGKSGWLIVTIDKNGKRTIYDQHYNSNDSLRERFDLVLAAKPKATVAINADRRVPYESVTTVLLLAQRAGFSSVSLFVGHRGQDLDTGKPSVTGDHLDLLYERSNRP